MRSASTNNPAPIHRYGFCRRKRAKNSDAAEEHATAGNSITVNAHRGSRTFHVKTGVLNAALIINRLQSTKSKSHGVASFEPGGQGSTSRLQADLNARRVAPEG